MSRLRGEKLQTVKGIIYKATNIVNGRCYIGQTIATLADRKYSHKTNALRCKYNSAFHNAIRKYGWENFEWEILCETDSKEKLNALERFYIACYRTMVKIYNMTEGGEGSIGFRQSPESRHKMSLARKGEKNVMYGKHHSEETRKKIAESQLGNTPWNKGIPHTEEVRLKISQAKLGRKMSIASRIKMSESRKGERNHFYGKHHSMQTKKRQSEAKRGMFCGEKNPFYGKHHTLESRKKLSLALGGVNSPWYGRKHKPETLKKCSEARRLYWMRKKLLEGQISA